MPDQAPVKRKFAKRCKSLAKQFLLFLEDLEGVDKKWTVGLYGPAAGDEITQAVLDADPETANLTPQNLADVVVALRIVTNLTTGVTQAHRDNLHKLLDAPLENSAGKLQIVANGG